MQTVFDLPDTLEGDLNELKDRIEQFKNGSISATQLRTFRVPQGIYEQREADTYMLRVRFPAGAALAEQMRVLARVARRFGDGVLHVTSRQDIQVHRVLLNDIHPALLELYAAGLSTKGGGGNTVRNITGCSNAGVCPHEAFDVTPHAVALTEVLLPDPLSFQLPRKYKIAFAGCSRDCSGLAVNDLGFLAKRLQEDGSLGFAVYVGGGMGAKSRLADPLEDFVSADEVPYVAEAVKRVFDKHGNRKNRHRARLRFLIERIGLEAFRKLYEDELAELRKAGLPEVKIREMPGRASPPPAEAAPAEPGFSEWRRRAVSAQRQDGYHLVEIPLWLGDIAADTLQELAGVVEAHGEGMVRTSQQQNLVIRWVHTNELPALHAALAGLGLAGAEPAVLNNMVACTGAATCKLGICLSRGLITAVREALEKADLDLDRLAEVKIQVSGCPNSCGRHAVADVGFFGAARRVDGRLVPHYVFQLGGRLGEGRARLAEGRQTIPAKNVPALLTEFLAAFCRSSAPEKADFESFLETEGRKLAETLASKHRHVPDFKDQKSYYSDWGSEEMFSLSGRGPGECGAGVFDLIEVDLESAREAVRQGRRLEATVLAARALLITQGQEGRDAAEVLAMFTRYFLEENLVDGSFKALVEEAGRAAATDEPEESFQAESDEVSRFAGSVQTLYDNMDPSLRFKPITEEPAQPQPVADSESPAEVDRRADFRGLVCPMNYVKTKMILDQLAPGAVLSVLLDEPGSQSVPESVQKDGHDVLAVEQHGDHWEVRIQKV